MLGLTAIPVSESTAAVPRTPQRQWLRSILIACGLALSAVMLLCGGAVVLLSFEQRRQHPVPFIAGFNSFQGNLALVYPWTGEPPRAEVIRRIDRMAPLYGRKHDDEAVWDDLYGGVIFGASGLSHSSRHVAPATSKSASNSWTQPASRRRGAAGEYFEGVSSLIRFARIKPEDRSNKSIVSDDSGQSARVTIDFSVNGRPLKPAVEVWGLIDGK